MERRKEDGEIDVAEGRGVGVGREGKEEPPVVENNILATGLRC